jgi:hypothetical protein
MLNAVSFSICLLLSLNLVLTVLTIIIPVISSAEKHTIKIVVVIFLEILLFVFIIPPYMIYCYGCPMFIS